LNLDEVIATMNEVASTVGQHDPFEKRATRKQRT
jgi:hypothetical protein